ncbi:MAG: SufD family Fe-S cluster assembly protein [Bdellovibrionales bacterium]|nr:SufD family Fe-S cluster assembly protein [Bdellovibrionales bacterium]
MNSARPAWLESEQGRLKGVLSSLALPGRKEEGYRYTSLKDLQVGVAQAPAASGSIGPGEGAAWEALRAQGVYLADLLTAARERTDSLREALKLPRQLEKDPFAIAALANATAALFVQIPAGLKVDGVVSLKSLHPTGAEFPRLVILDVGAGAEVELIEEQMGEEQVAAGADGLACGLWLVRVGENAKARLSSVQYWGQNTRSFERRYLSAAKGAELRLLDAAFGGSQWQCRLETECLGEGARIEVKVAVRGSGAQRFDTWVSALHGVPRTSSSVEHWAAVGGRAKSTFNGNLVITPEGVQTDAFQKSRSLLLSREAEANAVPKLEIATDDVKCAHGASVSPVGDDQLFYLESRGIPRAEAERMIIDGFTEPVVSLLPTEGARERAMKAAASKRGDA